MCSNCAFHNIKLLIISDGLQTTPFLLFYYYALIILSLSDKTTLNTFLPWPLSGQPTTYNLEPRT